MLTTANLVELIRSKYDRRSDDAAFNFFCQSLIEAQKIPGQQDLPEPAVLAFDQLTIEQLAQACGSTCENFGGEGQAPLSSFMQKIIVGIQYCESQKLERPPFSSTYNLEVLNRAVDLGFEYLDPKLLSLALRRIHELVDQVNDLNWDAQPEFPKDKLRAAALIKTFRDAAQTHGQYGLLWQEANHRRLIHLLIQFKDQFLVAPPETPVVLVSPQERPGREYLLDLMGVIPVEVLFQGEGRRADTLFAGLYKESPGSPSFFCSFLYACVSRWQADSAHGLTKIQALVEDYDLVLHIFNGAVTVVKPGGRTGRIADLRSPSPLEEEFSSKLAQILLDLAASNRIKFRQSRNLDAVLRFHALMFAFYQKYFKFSLGPQLPTTKQEIFILERLSFLTAEQLLGSRLSVRGTLADLGRLDPLLLLVLLEYWEHQPQHTLKLAMFFELDFLLLGYIVGIDPHSGISELELRFFEKLFSQVASGKNKAVLKAYLDWIEKKEVVARIPSLLVGALCQLGRLASSFLELKLHALWALVYCPNFFTVNSETSVGDSLAATVFKFLSHFFTFSPTDSRESQIALGNFDEQRLQISQMRRLSLALLSLPSRSDENLQFCLNLEWLIPNKRGSDCVPLFRGIWGLFFPPYVTEPSGEDYQADYVQFLGLLFRALPSAVCDAWLFQELNLNALTIRDHSRGLVGVLNLDLKKKSGLRLLTAYLKRQEFWQLREGFSEADFYEMREGIWYFCIQTIQGFFIDLMRLPREYASLHVLDLVELLEAFSGAWHHNFFFQYVYPPSHMIGSLADCKVAAEQPITPAKHLSLILQECLEHEGLVYKIARSLEGKIFTETSPLIDRAYRSLENFSVGQLQLFAASIAGHECLILPVLSKVYSLKFVSERDSKSKQLLQSPSQILWLMSSDGGGLPREVVIRARMALLAAHLKRLRPIFNVYFPTDAHRSLPLKRLLVILDQLDEVDVSERQGIYEKLQRFYSLLSLDLLVGDGDVRSFSNEVPTGDYLCAWVQDHLVGLAADESHDRYFSKPLDLSFHSALSIFLECWGAKCTDLERECLTIIWAALPSGRKLFLWAKALEYFEKFPAAFTYFLGPQGVMHPECATLSWIQSYFMEVQSQEVNGDAYPLEAFDKALKIAVGVNERHPGSRMLSAFKELMSGESPVLLGAYRDIGMHQAPELRALHKSMYLFMLLTVKLSLFISFQSLQIIPGGSRSEGDHYSVYHLADYFVRFFENQPSGFSVIKDLITGLVASDSDAPSAWVDAWSQKFRDHLKCLLGIEKSLEEQFSLDDRSGDCYRQLLATICNTFDRPLSDEGVTIFHYLLLLPQFSLIAFDLLAKLPQLKISEHLPPSIQKHLRLKSDQCRLFPYLLGILKSSEDLNSYLALYSSRLTLNELLFSARIGKLPELLKQIPAVAMGKLVMAFPDEILLSRAGIAQAYLEAHSQDASELCDFLSVLLYLCRPAQLFPGVREAANKERMVEVLVILICSCVATIRSILSYTEERFDLNENLVRRLERSMGLDKIESQTYLSLLFRSDLIYYNSTWIADILTAFFDGLCLEERKSVWLQSSPILYVISEGERGYEEKRASIVVYLLDLIGDIHGHLTASQLKIAKVLFTITAFSFGAAVQLSDLSERDQALKRLLQSCLVGCIESSDSHAFESACYMESFQGLYSDTAVKNLTSLFQTADTNRSSRISKQIQCLAQICRCLEGQKPALEVMLQLVGKAPSQEAMLAQRCRNFIISELTLPDADSVFRDLLVDLYGLLLENEKLQKSLMQSYPSLFDDIQVSPRIMSYFIKLRMKILNDPKWKITLKLPEILRADSGLMVDSDLSVDFVSVRAGDPRSDSSLGGSDHGASLGQGQRRIRQCVSPNLMRGASSFVFFNEVLPGFQISGRGASGTAPRRLPTELELAELRAEAALAGGSFS